MQLDLKDRYQQLLKRSRLILTKQAGAPVRNNLDSSNCIANYRGI
jgi:hypothetical protein